MNGHTPAPTIDELLDRAVQAINRGDRATANALAGRVLEVDDNNLDAEELLATPAGGGTIRRLTIMFADLVDSTALSTRIEPETYRTVVGRYRDEVLRNVNRYDGHIGSTKGDGLLAVFGHPTPHEDDVGRAVRAGLDITNDVAALSERVRRRFGFDIDVRVGIHRGLVYLDTEQDDVYGLGANLAARICSLAQPGTVAVSDAVARLVRDSFQLEAREPQAVKGVDGLVGHYRAVAELDPTRHALGPLVGRQREVDYLRDAWSQAVVGTLRNPGVVFVGEGGIGKSRLAAAAIEMAVASHAVVLEMFGSPFHTDTGLRPVRKLLERRCGIDATSDPAQRLAKLEAEITHVGLDPTAMVPMLAPVLAIRPEAGYRPALVEGSKLHSQIATAVYNYLLACMGNGAALMVIEDLHWFDPDTIEVVHQLIGADTGRLLVVVTGREHVAWPDNVRIFDLRPLTDEQADELILALDPAMTSHARDEVRHRCDGIPLYIEEVMAKILEQQVDSEVTQVPDTLYEALLARLPSNRNAVLVAQAAAIVGGVVDRGLLLSIVDLAQDDLDQAIGELTVSGVLQPVRNDVWRFRHELLREVTTELVPPSLRGRLHGRVGDVLAAASTTGNPEWRLVAHHYEEAKRYDAAASAYEHASAVARQRGALGEARSYLARAVENIERSAPGPERDEHEIALRLQRGFLASVALGHASAEAAADFEHCLRLIGTRVSPQLYATLSALWSYYTARGELRRATKLAESLRSRLADMPPWARAVNKLLFGGLAWFRGDFADARALNEASATMAGEMGEPRVEDAWFLPNEPFATIYTYLAVSRFMEGDLAGAEAAFGQTRRRCEILSFPHGMFSLAYGKSLETWLRIEAGQLDRAAELVAELAELGKQHGFDEWMMVAATQDATVRSVAALASDEPDPAMLQALIETMTAVVQTWRAYDLKVFLMCYDAVLARLLSAAGRQDAARDRVRIALELADETEMHFYDSELLRVQAHTSDDPQVCHSGLREAVELARVQGAVIFELRAAADDFELVGESARAALADAVGRFPPEQSWPELTRARALLG
ncbi:ATP-binding protein [Mycobacterium noviomagense]|uniref:Adenylate cyclase n=1 Tax=Mycobacterium noviomagense TaxID=459858 RepID=A0A7I7PHE0_9MYCO|nr:adenylate/guanylate cyclase domain-containing protein [Mycobacterium noviomagense]ORB14641.1 adenylate/guanylate cyclase domain-containing protein [Mycobacterium noviomagense]BBY08047.1 adenylate cyclase [Mycobacterium noviomagense]